MPTLRRDPWLLLAAAIIAAAPACVDAEGQFTAGRLEDLCDGIVPICNVRASCVLGPSRFLRSSFPGGQQLVVRSDEPDKKLLVRLFFTEMVFPGTELIVQARSPDCSGVDTEQLIDVDIFELAGDDVTLEFELALPETGDHLLEVFGDLSADYLMTVDIE